MRAPGALRHHALPSPRTRCGGVRLQQVNGWKLATTINMAIIFFIFGVTLDTSELKSALKAWKAILYGEQDGGADGGAAAVEAALPCTLQSL
jgi:hypothetical protein